MLTEVITFVNCVKQELQEDSIRCSKILNTTTFPISSCIEVARVYFAVFYMYSCQRRVHCFYSRACSPVSAYAFKYLACMTKYTTISGIHQCRDVKVNIRYWTKKTSFFCKGNSSDHALCNHVNFPNV